MRNVPTTVSALELETAADILEEHPHGEASDIPGWLRGVASDKVDLPLLEIVSYQISNSLEEGGKISMTLKSPAGDAFVVQVDEASASKITAHKTLTSPLRRHGHSD